MKHNETFSAEHWASQEAFDALHALGSSEKGLSKKEVISRAKHYGQNVLPHVAGRKWYLIFLSNFVHFFALLLWAGAVLVWIAGMPQLAWAIIAVIIINGVFSYWQEFQAERAAEALRALLPYQVTVRRSGEEKLINVSEIVPGDLLILTEGESIPADARIVKAEYLRLDVSSFTGESRPVPCSVEKFDVSTNSITVFPNLVYAGTSVAGGRGEAVVFAIGANTRFGRIAELTQVQEERPSPLQLELRRVTRLVTILSVGLGILFFTVGTLFGGLTLVEGFLFAIGIIVANVPEGLLPTLTLSLAIGVRRMAKRNALMKKLSAVETLGATTVILTDKTGTLTENEMTVREVWANGFNFQIGGTGYEPVGEITIKNKTDKNSTSLINETLQIAALCCDAHLNQPPNNQASWKAIGDPTEIAILVAGAKAGLTADVLNQFPRLAELPFDSIRKRMTTIQNINNAPIACIKGATNEIISRCTKIKWRGKVVSFDKKYQELVQTSHENLARQGLRVLAVAKQEVGGELLKHNGWIVDEV